MLNLKHGQAYLATPKSGKGAGVLLVHAWWGLNDFFIKFADRLAAEGFVVLAPDLFEGEVATTIEEAETLSSAKNDETRIVPQLNEALDHLKSLPQVTSADLGIVGISFGAAWGIEMTNARPDVVGALVLFYGSYTPDLSKTRAAVQGHFASDDEFEPRESVEGLEKALTDRGLEANFYVYEGQQHWFFEPDRPQYHPESARLAYEATVKFLKDKLPAR